MVDCAFATFFFAAASISASVMPSAVNDNER
jgi:hypothetical protein